MKALVIVGALLAAMVVAEREARADTEFWLLETLNVLVGNPATVDLCHAVRTDVEDEKKEEFTTEPHEYWVLGVKEEGAQAFSYYILFGPDPDSTATPGRGATRVSSAGTGALELYVIDGVAYFFTTQPNVHPYGGTNGGSGVGDGTGFTVWSRANDDDYFVCLEGSGVVVHPKAPGAMQDVPINWYLRVPDNGTLGTNVPTVVTRLQALNSLRNRTWLTIVLAAQASVGIRRPLPY